MKHKLFSRFISVLLAVVMLASLMSMPSLATDDVQEPDPAVTSGEQMTDSTESDVADPTADPAAQSDEITDEGDEDTSSGDNTDETVVSGAENDETVVSDEENDENVVSDEENSEETVPGEEEATVPSEEEAVSNDEAASSEEEDASSQEETAPAAVQLTAEAKDENDNVVANVTAEADEGVIPEGASLVADLLTGNDAETAAAELDEAGVEYDGYMALDIHLEDANGNEVEPNGEVRVVMVAPAALPEDADPTTVAVQHHEEQDNGEVKVEEVASAADTAATPATLSLTEDSTERPATGVATENTDVTAAFTVENFSSFTVTWQTSGWNNRTTELDFECKTTDGGALPSGLKPGIAEDTLQSGEKIYFTENNPALAIAGYTFEYAKLNSSKVDSITAEYHGIYWAYNGSYYFKKPTVTLYYTKNDDSGDSDTGNGKTITFQYYPQRELVGAYPDYEKAPKDTVKFTVNLLDENGNLTNETPSSIGWNGNTRTFDQDTVTVKELISTIAVDNYTLEDGYAFFFWNGNTDINTDLEDAGAHPVTFFQNFDSVSNKGDGSAHFGETNYNGNVYHTIGYQMTQLDGSPYNGGDWNGTNCFAYEYGGVLHVVLKPITEDVSYKTFFYNYAESGEHIVDTTEAHDMEYLGNRWIGKLTMTEKPDTDLTSPGAGYTFVGWYDSQDATGNGDGNRIYGEEELTRDKTVYARWEYTASQDELVITKSFVDADGESIDPPAGLDHIDVTGNAIWGDETKPFTVRLSKDEETGDFKGTLSPAYFYKDYQVTGETMYDGANEELADSSKWSRDSFTVDRKYDDVDLTISEPVNFQDTTTFNITAAKLLLVRADGNTGYVTMIQLPSEEEQEAITNKLLTGISGLQKVEWQTLDEMQARGVAITYNDNGTVTLNFSNKSDWNKFYTGDFALTNQTMTGSLVNKRTDEDEYPVRFYLEGIEKSKAKNYKYTDAWATLESLLWDGYANVTTSATPMYVFDEDLSEEVGYDSSVTGGSTPGGIKGDANVETWMNKYHVSPALNMTNVAAVLTELTKMYPGTGIEDAVVASAGGTSYKVSDILEDPSQFQIVYTQVTQNHDQITEHHRGNGDTVNGQDSYHVHLTIKKNPGNLTITKTYTGVDRLPDDFAILVTNSVNQPVQTLTLDTASVDPSTDNKYTWNLEMLDEDTYTVTETAYEVTNKDLAAKIKVADADTTTPEEVNDTTASVKVADAETSTVDITNTYTDAAGDLKITKTLTDMNALKGNTASFIFKITNTLTNKAYYQTLTFTGAAEDVSCVLSNLPAGNYKVEELGVSGYTGACDEALNDDGTDGSITEDKKYATVAVSAQNPAEVSFTNNRSGNTPGGNSFAYNQFTYGADEQWHWSRADNVAPGNGGAESSEPATN